MVALPTPLEPALFRAIPGAAEVFPWLPLGDYPTPVERIEGLLPRGVELWVKHENACSNRYGGNKVRKLEFLLAQAEKDGRRRLVTFGGTGSHHVMATAAHAPAHGFEVEAILFPQAADDHVRALLLAERALGARLLPVPTMAAVFPRMLRARLRPDTAWLAGGGSCPRGTLGWVSAGFELLEQIEAGLPRPDVVYGALGSCGTMAGLWWSLRGEPLSLTAVRVANAPMGAWATQRLLRGTDALLAPLGPARRRERAKLSVDHRFLGRGYGLPTAESRAAVGRAAAFGLELEPIYTGKVMAALLADAAEGRLDGKRVLFLQTNATTDLRRLASGDGPEALPSPLRSLFHGRAPVSKAPGAREEGAISSCGT